jgi:hypothetical protein
VGALRIKNFPRGLRELLQKLAAADGVTLNDLVVRLLHEHLYGFPPPTEPIEEAPRRPRSEPLAS